MNLDRTYARYNRLYFRNSLPRNTIVKFGRLSDCIAEVTWAEPPIIVIHKRFRPWKKLVLFSLLHEMAHLGSEDFGHGQAWQREMMRLARAGAFATLW
jgi:hypothetical protein